MEAAYQIFSIGSNLYEKKVFSNAEYQHAKNTYLSHLQSYENAKLSIYNQNMSILQSEQTIFDLEQQQNEQLNQLEIAHGCQIISSSKLFPTKTISLPPKLIFDMEPIITLKNIDIYQKKLMILHQISLNINKGEFVYLIGKTGTGKSSILKLLLADEKAHGEQAEIVGFDLKKIKTKQIPYLRRRIGIIFQDYQLLSEKTVFENLDNALKAIGWKLKNERYERVMKTLDMVGLSTKHFKYPHQLSGGEQQRVCIARALLNDPELIIADEPTGNLDPITSEEIFQIFHHINKKGTTVLIATHDFMMIDKFPSRSLLIEDGKIIDSGL